VPVRFGPRRLVDVGHRATARRRTGARRPRDRERHPAHRARPGRRRSPAPHTVGPGHSDVLRHRGENRSDPLLRTHPRDTPTRSAFPGRIWPDRYPHGYIRSTGRQTPTGSRLPLVE
jgi:hypothetical protein